MSFFVLFVAGIIAYVVSTLSGGGGALILLPIVGFYLHPSVVAPIVNLGNMIGRPVRLILFWRYIDWKIVLFWVPSAILGAIVGAFIFVQLKVEWVQILLGIFLLSTVFQFRFGKRKQSFKMKHSHFIPLGFAVTLVSTLFGATGAIMNPFYINMGLLKERMIATKTANSFIAGIAQLSSYTFLGAFKTDLWWYGIIIGIGAVIGNLIGKKLLHKMNEQLFLKFVILIMMLSGTLLIVRAI